MTSISQAVVNITFDAASNSLTLAKRTGNTVVSLRGQSSVMSGTIVMYTGSAAPSGWRLCDGTNGTPDLRNRFIYGWGAEAINTRGGATSYATSSAGGHDHSVNVYLSSLTVDQIPYHTHVPAGGYNGYPDGGRQVHSGQGYQYLTTWSAFSGKQQLATDPAGSNYGHNHSAPATSWSGEHTHTISTLPPYYRLAYIIKI